MKVLFDSWWREQKKVLLEKSFKGSSLDGQTKRKIVRKYLRTLWIWKSVKKVKSAKKNMKFYGDIHKLIDSMRTEKTD